MAVYRQEVAQRLTQSHVASRFGVEIGDGDVPKYFVTVQDAAGACTRSDEHELTEGGASSGLDQWRWRL